MLPIWFGEHRSTLMGEKTTLRSEAAVPNNLRELSWRFTCCKIIELFTTATKSDFLMKLYH